MYSPPRYKISIEEYEDFFRHFGDKFIIGGDWNVFRLEIKALRDKMMESETSHQKFKLLSFKLNKILDLLDFFILHGKASNYLTIKAS